MNVHDTENPFSSSGTGGSPDWWTNTAKLSGEFLQLFPVNKPKSTKTNHKKVEKNHTEIGSLKKKSIDLDQFLANLRTYVPGLRFPFNSKRVLELIPMTITLGVFGSVTNATKPSTLLLNVLFSGPPACSLCVRVTLLVDQNISERRNIRCMGGSAKHYGMKPV